MPEAFEDDSMSNVGESDKMSDQMALETSILESAKILAVEKQAASNNADGRFVHRRISLFSVCSFNTKGVLAQLHLSKWPSDLKKKWHKKIHNFLA